MKRIITRIAALFLAILLLSSCNTVVNWIPGREIIMSSDHVILTDAEVRLLALSFKTEFQQRYGELLGEDFWALPVSESMSYEDYIREYFVFRECRALIYLNERAFLRQNQLTDIEEEALSRAARTCYEELGDAERAYTKAREKDVVQLMRYYLIAEKEIAQLSSDEVSVSDEESRVADISVIRIDSRERGEEVLERLSHGESFRSVAAECTLDRNVNYSVRKGELIPELEGPVFQMQNGEISALLEAAGSYYIIRVNNAYNTLLSGNNKSNILAERAFGRWSAYYESSITGIPIRRNELLWENIRLNEAGQFTDPGIFSALQTLTDS